MIAILIGLLLQAAAIPKASISGVVIDGGAPYIQPLFHARVQLERDSGSPIVMRTGDDGRFVFSGLSSGRYRLTVTYDSFIRQTATVAVTAGQDRNDIRIALQYAPTIVGRVKDLDNAPIQGLLVEAMKVTYGPRGDRSVVAVVSAFSDDRGEFHLYWLDPGDYYLRASSPQSRTGTVTGQTPPVYAPAYYPGFQDPRGATKFQVRIGTQLSAYDFKLQPSNFAGLRGQVSNDATGAPVASTITLTPEGAVASTQKYEGRSSVSVPPTRDDGAYLISGVPPGTYVVTASANVGGESLRYAQKVTLKAINSLNLLLSPGVSVNGRIVTENGSALDVRAARVVLESIDPDLPSPAAAAVDAKGQFSAGRVGAGDYSIRLLGLTGGTYLKSATSGETDILAKPLQVDTASPMPIRIELGSDGGNLEGAVYDNADHLYEGAKVVLAPDAARRNLPNQFFLAESGDGGRFTIGGIPPGEYKLFAWPSLEPNAFMDPSFMENFERLGVTVNILPKADMKASVRLIPLE
jgi:hypothetical protein